MLSLLAYCIIVTYWYKIDLLYGCFTVFFFFNRTGLAHADKAFSFKLEWTSFEDCLYLLIHVCCKLVNKSVFVFNSFILLKSHRLNDEKMEQTGMLFCYHLTAKISRGRDSIAYVLSHPPLN